jgi:hypothetical protein
VPEAGLVVDTIHCLFGMGGSSNVALAFTLGENLFELFGSDLLINGVVQPRANGITTLPDGTTIERAAGGVEVVSGTRVVDSRIHFNDPTGRVEGSRVGYWCVLHAHRIPTPARMCSRAVCRCVRQVPSAHKPALHA